MDIGDRLRRHEERNVFAGRPDGKRPDVLGRQAEERLEGAREGRGMREAEFEGQMIVGALGAAVEKDAKEQLDRSLEAFEKLVL